MPKNQAKASTPFPRRKAGPPCPSMSEFIP